jgi:hypothetical protein
MLPLRFQKADTSHYFGAITLAGSGIVSEVVGTPSNNSISSCIFGPTGPKLGLAGRDNTGHWVHALIASSISSDPITVVLKCVIGFPRNLFLSFTFFYIGYFLRF